MRRFLIGFLVLGLMAGSVATAEAKKRPKQEAKQNQNQKAKRKAKQEANQEANLTRVERTVEGSYGPHQGLGTGCDSALSPWVCVIIPTHTTEAFFTAKVTDAHGQPVFVEVYEYGSGGGREVTQFCGETTRPIRFPPGSELYFFVAVPVWGVQLDCTARSVKTTGTISVTLSNLPPAQPVHPGPER